MKLCVIVIILAVALMIAVNALVGATFDGGELRCQEDEVAVHGGLESYYDPDAPLACVAIDDLEERWR